MDSTARQLAKRAKARGLQRLRWFCQMCEKQCRDENGFKCHCESASHIRQMALFREDPQRFVTRFSDRFQRAFLQLLAQRFPGRRVDANVVYQEYIGDRDHIHMNATRWKSLAQFVTHLADDGLVDAQPTERGGHTILLVEHTQRNSRKPHSQIVKKPTRDDGNADAHELAAAAAAVAAIPPDVTYIANDDENNVDDDIDTNTETQSNSQGNVATPSSTNVNANVHTLQRTNATPVRVSLRGGRHTNMIGGRKPGSKPLAAAATLLGDSDSDDDVN